jgi:hypothetical protein
MTVASIWYLDYMYTDMGPLLISLSFIPSDP